MAVTANTFSITLLCQNNLQKLKNHPNAEKFISLIRIGDITY